MNPTVWKALSVVSCLAALAACVVAVVMGGCPTTLQTTEGGTCFMKCHWTFLACTPVMAIAVVMSLVQLVSRQAFARRVAVLGAMLPAIVALLFVHTPLMGICAKPMHCHDTALGFTICAAIVIIIGIVCLIKADSEKAEKPKMGL